MNTGKVKGKESILLFINDMVASLTPDVRRLRNFEKIELKSKEKKTVSFYIPAESLAFVNKDNKKVIESGDFTIQVGSLATTIKCTETKEYK